MFFDAETLLFSNMVCNYVNYLLLPIATLKAATVSVADQLVQVGQTQTTPPTKA